MEWYLKVLKNYVGFEGRARRKEYWMFNLFNVIAIILLSFIESFTGISPVLSGVYSVAVFLPSLAVGARRLHDIGKSAWWLLIGLIPIIGGLVLLVFTLLKSEDHDNKYGPNPKQSI
ncbi:DUF805 domain-containing protein [Bacillus sp. JJ664]